MSHEAKDENRCWPGYEPVPGKKPHSQGSCRPKAESELKPSEKSFRAKRRKQLDKWESEHPDTRKSASQHLNAPGTHSKAKKKSTAAKRKCGAKKRNTFTRSLPRKTAAKKS